MWYWLEESMKHGLDLLLSAIVASIPSRAGGANPVERH
jgi:hypothetical protein